MRRILVDIHEYLRDSRAHSGPNVGGSAQNTKKYERFERIGFGVPRNFTMTLSDALAKRRSDRTGSGSIEKEALGDLLGGALANRDNRRPYPSGGALYPIETYLLALNVNELPRGSYHYRPDLNAVEKMFPIPNALTARDVAGGDHEHPLVIIFTALWERSHKKYHDFALELALMEVGHMMQSLQLVSSALSLASCPMGGFRDNDLNRLLDLDVSRESVLCAMTVA